MGCAKQNNCSTQWPRLQGSGSPGNKQVLMEWALCSAGWHTAGPGEGGRASRAGGGPGHVVCLPPGFIKRCKQCSADGSFSGDPGLSSGLTGAKDSRHHTLNKAGLLEQLSQAICSLSPKIPVKEKSSLCTSRPQRCGTSQQLSEVLLQSKHLLTQQIHTGFTKKLCYHISSFKEHNVLYIFCRQLNLSVWARCWHFWCKTTRTTSTKPRQVKASNAHITETLYCYYYKQFNLVYLR